MMECRGNFRGPLQADDKYLEDERERVAWRGGRDVRRARDRRERQENREDAAEPGLEILRAW